MEAISLELFLPPTFLACWYVYLLCRHGVCVSVVMGDAARQVPGGYPYRCVLITAAPPCSDPTLPQPRDGTRYGKVFSTCIAPVTG